MFSSVSPAHPLEISRMLNEMTRRLSVAEQYVEVMVEEADMGRADLIANRVYGSTDWTWLIFKFASLKTMNQTIAAGTRLRLPSIPNVLAAMRREQAESVPIFSYFATQAEMDAARGLGADGTGGGTANATEDIFDSVINEAVFIGQPLVIQGTSVSLAENNGTEYKVTGVSVSIGSAGEQIQYSTRGEVSVKDWGGLLGDDNATVPAIGTTMWLAENGRGLLSIAAPQTAGKHAVRVGTIRAGGVLFVDIGQPIGL